MKALALLGALLAPVVVSAVASQPVELEPVVVTATRSEQPVREALAAITVITREQIERAQATDIVELLRFHAGLDVGRTGGAGQTTSIFIRGAESNHTLLLIDGVRVNPATAGGAALQNVAPEMIERIEILRGPRATLYGSDAIGGVINVITRGADRPGAEAGLRLGAEHTEHLSARLAYGDTERSLVAQLQRIQTDGFPARQGALDDSAYDNSSFNLGGRIRGGLGSLGARLWRAEGTVAYQDFALAPVSQDYENQVAAVDYALDLTPAWALSLTASRGEDQIRQRDANFLGTLDFVRTVRPQIDGQLSGVLGAHRLTFGAGAWRDEVDAESFGSAIRERRDVRQGFVQEQFSAGRHRALAAVSLADYEGFGNQVTWNAEYGFDLLADTRLIAAAGSGFRAPDATDRFGFGGNAALDPEVSRSFELGLRQRFGEAHSLDLRLFRNDIDDLISVEFDPANDPDIDFGFRAVNIDQTRNEGAELAYGFTHADWSARLGGIVQDPVDRSNDARLLRRAERTLTASVQRRFGGHSLGLDVLGTSERADVAADSGLPTTTGGYALLNLTGGLQLHPRIRLDGRIENLLDKDYETAAGFAQPGSSVFVTLSARY